MLKQRVMLVIIVIIFSVLINIVNFKDAYANITSNVGYLGPTHLLVDEAESLMYIVLEGLNQVLMWDLNTDSKIKTLKFNDSINTLALSPNHKHLLALTGSSQGQVVIIDYKTHEKLTVIDVGHTPVAAAISPQGDTMYVANRFTNDISFINLDTLEVIHSIPVLREPVAVKLSLDGQYLFVANLLPVGPANTPVVTASVSVINTESLEVKHISLVNGSTGLRGLAMSPDGKYIYVTHLLSRYQYPITQLDRGWVNTNAISIIDASNQSYLATFLLDSVDLGAPNPWAISCSTDGQFLLATHASSHELSIIDREQLHHQLNSQQRTPIATENDLTFLYHIRTRVNLPGNGPRALAIVGGYAYIAEYFSDTISKVRITLNPPSLESFSLSDDNLAMSDIRRGELIFNDATYAFQQWQSCTSCHLDGRTDGFAWDQMNTGIGNPAITVSLVVSHDTPPTMATGLVPTAEKAVRDSLGTAPEEDAIAVDMYLKSLRPVPSPYLINGELSPAAKHGEKTFSNIGCIKCHSGDYFTDGLIHNVGSQSKYMEYDAFVTPSLLEIWRTAPYFHDGRTDSLYEVTTFFLELLGEELTHKEIQDLVQYMLTL